jgi:hypothetical protein
MIYKRTKGIGRAKEILDAGMFMGYPYMILSLGSHPCAYVFIDKDNPLFEKHYDEIHNMIDLNVHGGLTLSDNVLHRVLVYSDKYKCDTLQKIEYDWIIGWDYAHYGDFVIYPLHTERGKRWTTKEIKQEVEYVIAQIYNQINKEV